MKTIAMLTLATIASLSGCAMSPEQQQEFRNNFMQGLAAGQRPVYQQPVYQQPVYQMPIQRPKTTTCRKVFDTVSCETW